MQDAQGPGFWPSRSPPSSVTVQAKEKKVDLKLWKKNRAAERIQREYKTAEEVLAEQSEKGTAAPVVQQTILDMRGPQARVITDMEELTTGGQLTAEDDIPMPELQHNLRVMVDLAAADIQRLDGKLRHSKVWLPRLALSMLWNFTLLSSPPILFSPLHFRLPWSRISR